MATILEKTYRCSRCGYETRQATNHYGPTWSWGRHNICPKCPPWAKLAEFGAHTLWNCVDMPPLTEEQKTAQIENTRERVNDLLERARTEAPQHYEQMMVSPFGPVPSYVQDDPRSEWWLSDDASALLSDLIELLDMPDE